MPARQKADAIHHSTDPTAEDYVGPKLPEGRVILRDAFGGSQVVQVEISATGATRARGLMWRRSLADGMGMLFIFPDEQNQSFWMRNTLIPLDLIFINKEQRIVGIVQQAEPRTLSPRTVNRPSRYVLEVPGGWTDKVGVREGSDVQLRGTSMIVVEP